MRLSINSNSQVGNVKLHARLASSSGFYARTAAVNLREEQVALEVVRIKNTHTRRVYAFAKEQGGHINDRKREEDG